MNFEYSRGKSGIESSPRLSWVKIITRADFSSKIPRTCECTKTLLGRCERLFYRDRWGEGRGRDSSKEVNRYCLVAALISLQMRWDSLFVRLCALPVALELCKVLLRSDPLWREAWNENCKCIIRQGGVSSEKLFKEWIIFLCHYRKCRMMYRKWQGLV